LFFWNQAREFYKAGNELSIVSAPLPFYYSFLNATKALLKVEEVSFEARHGLESDRSGERKPSLANEKVTFSTGKVCGNLRTLLNGQSSHQTKTYSLKTLFYHLPFLHRPFVLSYKNTTELFLPFNHAQYVEKDDSSSEAWIEGKVPKRYYHSRFSQYLPKNFEIDKGAPNEEQITVRRKSRDQDPKIV
jgi:hypothetical protein